jgi:hypothetical protein
MNLGVKKMDAKSYDILVRLFLAEKVLGRGSAPLTLPPDQLDWAKARSRVLIDDLRSAGYRVEGDLEDLMPVDPDTAYVSPTALTDAQLGPIALKASTALLNRAGRMRDTNALLQARLDGASVSGRLKHAPRGLAGAGKRAAKKILRKD